MTEATPETVERDEADVEFEATGASNAYRSAAGLPLRTTDEPTDPLDVPELAHISGPEGGYGGEDGISNSGAANASEQTKLDQRAEAEDADEEESDQDESDEESETESDQDEDDQQNQEG